MAAVTVGYASIFVVAPSRSTCAANVRPVGRLICSPIELDTDGAILLLGKEMGIEIPQAAQDVVKKVRR